MTCLTPSVFSKRALGRTAGGGDDLRAQMMRDLDGRHADATRARVNEDHFAGLHPGHGLQRIPRGHEDDRNRRRFLKGQALRHPAHIGGPRERVRGKAEDGETEDTVSRRDVRHAFADGDDLARHFVAEDARIRRLGRDKAREP